MISRNDWKKPAVDLFYIKLKWSLWYIPIIFVIYLTVLYFKPPIPELGALNFITVAFETSKIYMVVIGVISGLAFFTHFVKNGVTRKDYYIGTALAGAGVSISVVLISMLLTWLVQLMGWATVGERLGFLSATLSLPIVILALSLYLFSHYIAGWVVSIGFYRFGGLRGTGLVILALLYVSLVSLIWDWESSVPLFNFLNMKINPLSIPTSLGINLIIIAGGLWVARLMTKRSPIKLE